MYVNDYFYSNDILLFQITISNVPGLVNLLQAGEELADLMKLSPEQILLRWVNHQLEKVNSAMLQVHHKYDCRQDQQGE